MTRKTASQITDPELDALYDERDRYAAVVRRLEQMADAWEQRLPDVIVTATAVEAIRMVTARAALAARPAPDTKPGTKSRTVLPQTASEGPEVPAPQLAPERPSEATTRPQETP